MSNIDYATILNSLKSGAIPASANAGSEKLSAEAIAAKSIICFFIFKTPIS